MEKKRQDIHRNSGFLVQLDWLTDALNWEGEKPYTTCLACGKLISHQNDGGNGFCIDCAWEH